MKHSTQPAAGTDQSPANHPQALAWDHYITPAHAQELREQAAQWRAEQSHSNVGGYVLVLERKVVGWVSDIATAYGWLAGCIAIPATEAESFFIAVGGDFEAGAKKFVALDIRETARRDTERRAAVALATEASSYRIPGELYHRGQWCVVITGDAETVIVAYCSGPDFAKHREVPRAELEGGADLDELIRKEHDKLGFSYLVAQRSFRSQCLLVAGFVSPSDAQHFAEWIEGTVMNPHEYLAAKSAIWQAAQDSAMEAANRRDAEIREALRPVRAALPSDVAVNIDPASSGEGFTAWANELDLSDINGSRGIFEGTFATIADAASALAGFAVRLHTQRGAGSGVAA